MSLRGFLWSFLLPLLFGGAVCVATLAAALALALLLAQRYGEGG